MKQATGVRREQTWVEASTTEKCAAQTERIDNFVVFAPKIVAQSVLHFIRLLRGHAAIGVRGCGYA